MNKLTNKQLLKEVLDHVKEDMEDEEIIHLLLEKPISNNNEEDSIADKLADKLAKFGGSWLFICLFLVLLIIWIIINVTTISFDPYPFILLNLILSCISSFQAPIIMMAQNRQEQKDRVRNVNQYKINLKNEIILQDLHQKLDILLEQTKKDA